MKKIITLFTVALVSLSSNAYMEYDYKSGNSYYNIGDTHYGYNAKNGTNWNTTYDNNGGASGYDSNNNYWTNDKHDNYYNYGTGKSCFGTGLLRTCN